MTRIVSQPVSVHHCGPNAYGYWFNHSFDPVGTVRECECGRTWRSYRDHYDYDHGYMGVKWRRESWLARQWREWKIKRR